MLWGSNIRLTENDLQEILPPESPSSKASSSPEKNVITECTMVCWNRDGYLWVGVEILFCT